MSGAWEQDAAAGFVEELFAAHHGEIYAYLIRMLRDPELAADLTQDAFVKAYRNYDTLEKAENARAWLYQIAHRVALDHIRRQKIVRFLPWTGESHGAAPSTERLVMDAHLSSDMQRALERIPERQRAALLLAELHDLTGLELAAALGVSHVAARALLTRARESLRQALAAERGRRGGRGLEAEAARPRRTVVSGRPMSLGRPRRRPDDWPSATPAPSRDLSDRLDGDRSSRARRPGSTDHLAGCAECRTRSPMPTRRSATSFARCAIRCRCRRATCGPGPPRRSSRKPRFRDRRSRRAAGVRSLPCLPRRSSWPSSSGR